MGMELFVPYLGMVVDVQGEDAERLAQGVDVLADESKPAVGVIGAADAVRCWEVDHGGGVLRFWW